MGKKRQFNEMANKSRKCCCKCHQEEYMKRWEEYRSSQSSTNDTSHDSPVSEREIWVQGNLNSKGRVYGFGAKEVVMKQPSRLSVSTRSSSVNNYDTRELATRLNESVCKAAEEARVEELRKKIEEDVTAKLTAQFNNQWAETETALKNELAQEKATRERERKKEKSKMNKLWSFFKSQQAGSSIAPPDTTPSHDDDDDEEETTNLTDNSHE